MFFDFSIIALNNIHHFHQPSSATSRRTIYFIKLHLQRDQFIFWQLLVFDEKSGSVSIKAPINITSVPLIDFRLDKLVGLWIQIKYALRGRRHRHRPRRRRWLYSANHYRSRPCANPRRDFARKCMLVKETVVVISIRGNYQIHEFLRFGVVSSRHLFEIFVDFLKIDFISGGDENRKWVQIHGTCAMIDHLLA